MFGYVGIEYGFLKNKACLYTYFCPLDDSLSLGRNTNCQLLIIAIAKSKQI